MKRRPAHTPVRLAPARVQSIITAYPRQNATQTNQDQTSSHRSRSVPNVFKPRSKRATAALQPTARSNNKNPLSSTCARTRPQTNFTTFPHPNATQTKQNQTSNHRHNSVLNVFKQRSKRVATTLNPLLSPPLLRFPNHSCKVCAPPATDGPEHTMTPPTPPDHEAVFCGWLADHHALMFKVARSHEADPDLQQDLLQEILLQVWRSVPAFARHSSETTWIYRVALNTAFTWQRGQSRQTARTRHAIEIAALTTDPLVPATANPQLESLYQAIRALPRVDAALVIMHLDGLPYRDIAAVLGITENLVGVRLTRARKQLADILKEKTP